MKIKHLRYVVAINGLASCLFLAWALSTLWSDDQLPDVESAANWAPAHDLLAQGATPEPRTYTLVEATQRPLFRSSRRPFDPDAVAATADETAETPEPVTSPPPQPPVYDPQRLLLLGLWRAGPNAKALIGTAEAPEGQWLERGATIAGWTITSLDANGATLTSGENEFRLKLYVDNPTNDIGGLTQRF